jgi:hypothetical protein
VREISTACDSASITSVVSKWQPFSFIFNREDRKGGWVGDDSHVFSQKCPGEKGSVRRCVVMQQPVLLSPKFEAKSRRKNTGMTPPLVNAIYLRRIRISAFCILFTGYVRKPLRILI